MPRKKGLGRDIEKSIEIMESLMDSLKGFHKIPLKKGLHSNGVFEKDFGKEINDAKTKASELSNIIEDLKDRVRDLKPRDLNSSRFAEQRVVSKFLGFKESTDN
jgi:hypothetical protein